MAVGGPLSELLCRRYSDRAAQRADWKAGHKEECAALAAWKAKQRPLPQPHVRMIAKAVWRRCWGPLLSLTLLQQAEPACCAA